jgi:hypothetical protein
VPHERLWRSLTYFVLIKILKENRIYRGSDPASANPANDPDSGGKSALQPVRWRHVHFAAVIFRPETIPEALFFVGV